MNNRSPRPPKCEELIAIATISAALGIPVTLHDDGTAPSMYDLDLHYAGRNPAPAEVTTDVDPGAMGTVNFIQKNNAGSWDAPRLTRTWMLHTAADLQMKQLMNATEHHLLMAEQASVETLDDSTLAYRHVEWHASGGPGADPVVKAWEALQNMGVIRAISFAPIGTTAEISVHLQQGAGSWDGSADPIADWIGRFAADPARADNVRKLAGAQGEAHLVVFARMTGVDWGIWRALADPYRSGVLPTIDPVLPYPITNVWIFPVQGGDTVLTWSNDGWRRIPLVLPT